MLRYAYLTYLCVFMLIVGAVSASMTCASSHPYRGCTPKHVSWALLIWALLIERQSAINKGNFR